MGMRMIVWKMDRVMMTSMMRMVISTGYGLSP
jgi:hypothetical protein